MKAEQISDSSFTWMTRSAIGKRVFCEMVTAVMITAGAVHADLVGYWALDEGYGKIAYDSSGNANNGDIVNAIWGPGRLEEALLLDGTAYVEISPEPWATIDQQVTLTLWVYGNPGVPPHDNFTVGAFTNLENNEARALSAHIPWGNGRVYFDTGGTEAGGYDRIFKAASPQEYQEWHHWTLVKDAEIGEQSIYLDGLLWHSGWGMDRPIGGMDVTGFTIGAKPSHVDFFVGRIDDVQLYDTALTQEEIIQAMEGIPSADGQASRFLVVDDFESYGNQSPNLPFQTWLDGPGFPADEFYPAGYGGNGTGSIVGHDIWSLPNPPYYTDMMEKTITIPGSGQSMPLYFDNTGMFDVSETQRTFDPPQDWAGYGTQTLSLWFHGSKGNTGRLYVKINDTTKIVYEGDSTNIAQTSWLPWNIDLSAASALENVYSLAIGIESSDARGLVYIDDVRLGETAHYYIGSGDTKAESVPATLDLSRNRSLAVVPAPGMTEDDINSWLIDDGRGIVVSQVLQPSGIIMLELPEVWTRPQLRDYSRSVRARANTPIAEIGAVVTVGAADTPVLLNEQLIVQIDPGDPDVRIEDLIALAPPGTVERVRESRLVPNQFLLEVTEGPNDAWQVANLIHNDPRTLYSIPNWIILPDYRDDPQPNPNDKFFPDQWHLHNDLNVADINAPEAWATTKGDPDIKIAVIDSGFDEGHLDLASNIIESNLVNPPDAHGTAVAGCIGAQYDNGIGVTGVCPKSSLILVDYDLDVYEQDQAFRFAIENDADIICCAWGYHEGIPVPQPVSVAISFAADFGRFNADKKEFLGCVIVFAMTNESRDNNGDIPDISALDKVIAVSGSNVLDKAIGAGFGSSTDVLAPTGSIVTTDVSGNDGDNSGSNQDLADPDYTRNFGGTSASCAITAGVAGLILSADETLTREKVQEILQATADKIGGIDYGNDGHTDTHGYGRINAKKAVAIASQ